MKKAHAAFGAANSQKAAADFSVLEKIVERAAFQPEESSHVLAATKLGQAILRVTRPDGFCGGFGIHQLFWIYAGLPPAGGTEGGVGVGAAGGVGRGLPLKLGASSGSDHISLELILR